MKTTKIQHNGIGFFGILTIVLITLKLCKVINWSWWLVLLPLYWWIAVMLAIAMGGGLIVLSIFLWQQIK